MTLTDFIARLDGAKKSGKGWIARCPAHDDKNPSLSVSNGDGKILVKCHTGCSTADIVGAMGLSVKDLFSENGSGSTGKENRSIIATHDYKDTHGRFLFQKARFATKPKTKPRHKSPDGQWRWGAGTGKRPLYRLPEIQSAGEIIVVEGEKDADNLWNLGFKATTTPFGKWETEHIDALSGKDILIVGDNDSAGVQKVGKAVKALQGAVKSIKIVKLPVEGKPKGYDVSDFIAEFDEPEAAAEKLAILMEQAQEFEPEVSKADSFEFPPLTPSQTIIHGVLTVEPPEIEPILLYNGTPVLPRNIVGVIAAEGGLGKTLLVLQLGYAISGGGSLGPLKAAEPFNVLILLSEDPQEEANRRLWRIGKGDFPPGLHVASTVGRVGPLMRLEGNNPIRAQGFSWLRDTIKNHDPLDLLILDPKSRFYGLDENNNDHATQWITCLESLANEFDLTILFTHHVSKGRSGDMGQAMSRGASALVDGCRWVAGMTRLNPEVARRHSIEDERAYVEFDITKANYTAQLPNRFIFKRMENGLLKYIPLELEREKNIKRMLYDGIVKSETPLSRRDLRRGENGCGWILEAIENSYSTFSKKEINTLIDGLITDGFIHEIPEKNNRPGARKMWLKPVESDSGNFRQNRF